MWTLAALCVFGWLYTKSGPTGEIAHEIAAAGPDHVTAYFASPEEAVTKANALIAARDWKHLARYYDFSRSSATRTAILSGSYFNGQLTLPPEGAVERPFPAGYRFLYSEPTELDGILRVVVVGAPPAAANTANAPQASFFVRAEPEGYRIIPADAAGRIKASSSER
jgi:hypothetical protein